MIKHVTLAVLLLTIFFPMIYLFLSTFSSSLMLDQLISFFSSFSGRVGKLFLRSIIIGFSTSVVSTLIGIFLAIVFEYTKISGRKILYFISFLPFLIPPFLTTFSWIVLSGKVLGGLPIYNEFGVVLFLSFSYFPLATLIISLGIRNLDASHVEAGILFNRKKAIWKIILPLIKPHLLLSLLFIFFLAISEYTVPAFLLVNTYQNEIFTQFAAFYNLSRAVVLSIPLAILALGLVAFIYFYLKDKPFMTISSFTKVWKPFVNLSKPLKAFVYFCISTLILFSIIIPLVSFVLESKLGFIRAISISKNSILNSLWITVISSSLLTIFGFFSAYSFKNSKFFVLLLSIPLALSSPVIGISLINLYSSLPLPVYGTYFLLVLGYLIKFLPFSAFIFSIFLSQISSSLEEAGKMFTRNEFKILSRIFLLLSKPGFLAAFIISFIFIFGEIGITQLLSPPGFQTLPQRIEVIMHYGDYQAVASLSLILLSSIFFIVGSYLVVFR